MSPCPSYSTFCRVYHAQFSKVLKFRTESQHGKCNDCERFKQWRRTASSKADKDRVSQSYKQHLRDVMLDRRTDALWRGQGYDSLTAGYLDGPTWITICVDGMDTSKFAIPLGACLRKSQQYYVLTASG